MLFFSYLLDSLCWISCQVSEKLSCLWLNSKAARRKKREEARKLPEVSKEIYYDVSGDLKAVFGQTTVEDTAKEEETGWDQVEEEEEEEEEKKEDKDEQPAQHLSLFSADASAKTEESSGFKFSFFGDDTDTGTAETGELALKCLSGTDTQQFVFPAV